MYEPTLTLAERLALVKAQREAEIEASASAALPIQDAMFHPKDWPADARVWFYKAGINNDDIASMGAFWSPRMRRVVVPYRTLGGEAAWIARDPYWTKESSGPKYLFPQGVSRGGGAGYWHPYGGSGIVIVEDVLSAYRIKRDTDMSAVAAQGTSLDRTALVQIVSNADLLQIPVFIWLDNDTDGIVNWGQQAAARLRDRLGNLGVTAHNIVTPRDPKLHEPHEIREALEA